MGGASSLQVRRVAWGGASFLKGEGLFFKGEEPWRDMSRGFISSSKGEGHVSTRECYEWCVVCPQETLAHTCSLPSAY